MSGEDGNHGRGRHAEKTSHKHLPGVRTRLGNPTTKSPNPDPLTSGAETPRAGAWRPGLGGLRVLCEAVGHATKGPPPRGQHLLFGYLFTSRYDLRFMSTVTVPLLPQPTGSRDGSPSGIDPGSVQGKSRRMPARERPSLRNGGVFRRRGPVLTALERSGQAEWSPSGSTMLVTMRGNGWLVTHASSN